MASNERPRLPFPNVNSLAPHLARLTPTDREAMPDPQFYRACIEELFGEIERAVLGTRSARTGRPARAAARSGGRHVRAGRVVRRTGRSGGRAGRVVRGA